MFPVFLALQLPQRQGCELANANQSKRQPERAEREATVFKIPEQEPFWLTGESCFSWRPLVVSELRSHSLQTRDALVSQLQVLRRLLVPFLLPAEGIQGSAHVYWSA